jgi:hypothetical protein
LAESAHFLAWRRKSCAESCGSRPSSLCECGARASHASPIDEAKESAAPNEIPISRSITLDRLAEIDGELAKIVELRAFGGLTIDGRSSQSLAIDRARLARGSVAQA